MAYYYNNSSSSINNNNINNNDMHNSVFKDMCSVKLALFDFFVFILYLKYVYV